jgi:tetratricopeptide (TPR) repeat protein
MMKKNNTGLLLALMLCFGMQQSFGQTAEQLIKEGNTKYAEQDYQGAQESYQQAVTAAPQSAEGNFNLGNTLFQQQQYDAAAEQFRIAAENTTDPTIRAKAYHNMGNAMLEKKDYSSSIDAYKRSLRENPADADTKYNLSYAQQMLKQQQQQQQQKQKEQQNKQQQPQQKPEQQKDDKSDPKDQQQNESQPKDLDKKELDRVLKSLNEDDKAVQDKVNKQKARPAGGDPEKDW